MPDQDLISVVKTIIDANRYMTLATAGASGQPWASPVFYATADYTEFYWISTPEASHSRNLAQRPQLGIVIFDSGVPAGTGQGVYMSATAGQVAGHDLDRGLAIYPGPSERGWSHRYTSAELQAPEPFRLYRATVSEHSVLCPGDYAGCTAHGLPFDHRTTVRM